MTANEWLGVMKQASDFPQGMEILILKYGEMLIAEHEGKVANSLLNKTIMDYKTYNPVFSAWRKGDLVKIYGKEIRLTSEAYEKMGVGIVCDTDEGETTYIPYVRLIEDAKLIETISGRKNLPCE